ncbi:SulP family inorganic anion transporter [Caenimonas sedimenti]|uniref:SulP family inorganic anion transporter n=1 Tax=Caenimonas sedimenti TaxID=2596921 RepID=A0A562ZV39_9BURK|nr:SulP family inorganic anion transporter [Caenimonas sedimenti]TWO72241.1 SulP family inorganic anion transporter [Caenimonas sedimenti]
MSKLSRWLPFLNWPRPGADLLRNELMAGLTVALVMVPQCVAYAALAGMPLVTGLYAGLLPPLVAVLFGSSTRLSVGPAALTCVLTAASLSGLAEPASPQWVALAVWLALLSGLMQLALGAGGMAWVLNLVSAPVLLGFTQAAALLIIASQLPALLGAQGSALGLLRDPHGDPATLAFGLVSLALLVAGKRFAPRLPMVMIVVMVGALVSRFSGYSARGAVIGNLPAGLPTPYWPGWPGWETLGALLVPALVITLVSFLETASSAKIEAQRDGKRWNDNQDLLAQGLAKLASGFSGSFPTSTSFSRSAITLYAGGKTGWATVATVLFVLAALLLTSLLAHVPRAVLAAIVIAAVAGLLKPHALRQLWHVDRVEAATAVVTFAVTLLSAPRIYWGVLTGVLMGLTHFLYLRLHPRIIEVGLHPDGSLRDRHLWKLAPLAPQLFALRMDAELDFASASALERAIVEHLSSHPDVRHVCLFAQPINRIDVTGVEMFTQLRAVLAERGITLHISGIKLPVEKVLLKAGALDEGPLLKMYRTDTETLLAFGRLSP